MIVDASAVTSIFLRKTGCERLIDALASAAFAVSRTPDAAMGRPFRQAPFPTIPVNSSSWKKSYTAPSTDRPSAHSPTDEQHIGMPLE